MTAHDFGKSRVSGDASGQLFRLIGGTTFVGVGAACAWALCDEQLGMPMWSMAIEPVFRGVLAWCW